MTVIKFPDRKNDLLRAYGHLLTDAMNLQLATAKLLKICLEIQSELLGIKPKE
jgi:hypothetical protein